MIPASDPDPESDLVRTQILCLKSLLPSDDESYSRLLDAVRDFLKRIIHATSVAIDRFTFSEQRKLHTATYGNKPCLLFQPFSHSPSSQPKKLREIHINAHKN